MSDKPEALRLAAEFDGMTLNEFYEALGDEAAAELRRLAAVEAQLEEETKTHLEAEARDMALILALKAEQQQLTDWEAVAADQAMTIAMLQSERDALKAERDAATDLLRDFRDNYDCDEDAHKYGTQCRRCAAENLIDAARGAT